MRRPPSTDRTADLMLARRCLAGDEAARRSLFEAHRFRVHHVLFRMIGSNHEIDDAIQEAFLAIYRSLSIYRGDSLLSTWVDRITVRVGIRILRIRPTVPRGLRAVDTDGGLAGAVDRQAEAREALRRLYQILETITPVHRTAFALHAIDGRPLREVAETMGASVIATKLRVFRTRRKVEHAARSDEMLRPFLADTTAPPTDDD